METGNWTGEPDEETVALAYRLFDAARAGDEAELVRYVDAGVPVNLMDGQGNTLLMLAAYHGHSATVTALLARGANPDLANDKQQSPLAGAVFKQSMDIVASLVAAGADPDGGMPSARDTAHYFNLPHMVAALEKPTTH